MARAREGARRQVGRHAVGAGHRIGITIAAVSIEHHFVGIRFPLGVKGRVYGSHRVVRAVFVFLGPSQLLPSVERIALAGKLACFEGCLCAERAVVHRWHIALRVFGVLFKLDADVHSRRPLRMQRRLQGDVPRACAGTVAGVVLHTSAVLFRPVAAEGVAGAHGLCGRWHRLAVGSHDVGRTVFCAMPL